MQSFRVLRVLCAAIFLTTPGVIAQTPNSWTKPTSGNWEEPFWSAGHLPTIDDSAILFTNANWKALAIGAGTTANFPDSLRMRNLIVDAPVDSRNLLLLNWAGLSVPLRADGLLIGTNGALLSHFSAMDVGILTLNGPATFTDFAQSRFVQALVGHTSPARVDLTNGTFSAERLTIARGGPSSFHQYGGSNQVLAADQSGRLAIDTDGSYNLSGGDFKTTFIDLWPTRLGTAPRFHVTGGRAEIVHFLNIGGFIFTNNATAEGDWHPGVLELSGGHFAGGNISIMEGRVDHTGGTNQLTGVFLSAGADARADYLLSGGRLESGTVVLGSPEPSGTQRGFFTQHGGVHANSQSIIASGEMRAPEIMYFSGTYELFGGVLTSPGIGLDGGYFSQAGGTNVTPQLSLTNGGSYAMAAGTLVTSNTVVQNYTKPAARPRFVIGSGAVHHTERLFLESGGSYHLARGALLSADRIYAGAGTEVRLGGTVSSNSIFEVNGGFVRFEGTNSLGWLRFNGISHFDFAGGPSIIHFTQVGYPGGALDGELLIRNWHGLTGDQLYIDTADENTPSRIRSMTFVDPVGYPPGNYRARRKPSGEIVPLDTPQIAFTRSVSEMTLTWPEGYQLYSAPEITGPFQLVPNAQSGWNVAFSEPRRFFILRPEN